MFESLEARTGCCRSISGRRVLNIVGTAGGETQHHRHGGKLIVNQVGSSSATPVHTQTWCARSWWSQGRQTIRSISPRPKVPTRIIGGAGRRHALWRLQERHAHSQTTAKRPARQRRQTTRWTAGRGRLVLRRRGQSTCRLLEALGQPGGGRRQSPGRCEAGEKDNVKGRHREDIGGSGTISFVEHQRQSAQRRGGDDTLMGSFGSNTLLGGEG